jgi:hypothetical protein
VGRSTKRPKVTHSLFFEDDRGLKTILNNFPKIKFRGKGHEYDDVSLLLAHYKKWFGELYPYGEHFEDLVLKSRQVLEDKEKDDDGTLSDPREKLHAFRFQYKNKSAIGSSATPAKGAALSDEAKARIEANRQRAVELKRKRQAEEGGGVEVAAPSQQPEEMDMDELWRMEEERQAAERSQGASKQPMAPAGFDEEDDPFGYGGGFDDFDGQAPSATGAKAAAGPSSFDEEEDVFSFGCEFDEAPAPKPSPAPAAPEASATAKPMDSEIARRIAENRAQALARKAAAAKAAAVEEAPAAGAPVSVEEVTADAPPGAAPLEEDDDAFDFGCSGFDDP